MEIDLIRTHHPEGTNGTLVYAVAHTIELPWLNNQRRISCIPAGRYELKKRFTEKHKDHIIVTNVPGRDGILIHPANDALHELLGCIAPVTDLIGPGKGTHSRLANERVKELLDIAFDRGEKVFLNVSP
jgi:hypothetical protein